MMMMMMITTMMKMLVLQTKKIAIHSRLTSHTPISYLSLVSELTPISMVRSDNKTCWNKNWKIMNMNMKRRPVGIFWKDYEYEYLWMDEMGLWRWVFVGMIHPPAHTTSIVLLTRCPYTLCIVWWYTLHSIVNTRRCTLHTVLHFSALKIDVRKIRETIARYAFDPSSSSHHLQCPLNHWPYTLYTMYSMIVYVLHSIMNTRHCRLDTTSAQCTAL